MELTPEATENNPASKVKNFKNSFDGENYLETLDKGRSWIIMLACFGTFFIIGGNVFGVGIMHAVLLERYRESVSLTSLAGSLQTAFLSFGAPLASFLVDRYSCRTAVVLSGLLFTVGYLGTAFAPNIHTAIFTLGIVAGGGAGLGSTSSMIVIGFNFKTKRAIVLGVVLSGMGAGLFALAPLMQLSLDYYGTTGFFIIQAAISLNIVVFGAMYFPSKLEKHILKARNTENTSAISSESTKQNFLKAIKQYFEPLCNKSIFLLCVSMFLHGVGTYLIYLHFPVYIVFKGFSKATASYIVSLTGILSVVGRLVTGLVTHFNASIDIWLYSGSFGVASIATIILPHVSYSLEGNIAYAIAFGLCYGICYVVLMSVNMSIVDIKHVSAAIGIELFFGGIGSVIGPECAGLLIDNGGTYEQAITFAGGCLLAAAISSIFIPCFKIDTHKDDKQDDVEI